jgi:hypothetical protein
LLRAQYQLRIEEIATLKKVIANKEKIEIETQCLIDELKAELASMRDMIENYKITIVSMQVHLNETKKENARLSGVEDYNRELKDLLVKLGNEYTKDLPDIYQYFNSLTKEMLKEKDNGVTKVACKEFTSVEELMKICNENLPAIARNCIKLLFALLKSYNELLINKAGTHNPCQKKLTTCENLKKDNRTQTFKEEEKKRAETSQEESYVKDRLNVVTPQAIDFKNRKSRSTFISSCPDSNRNPAKDKALKRATAENVHESYANRSDRSHSKVKSMYKNKQTEVTMEANQVMNGVIISY